MKEFLKGQLHLHTNLSDGRNTPQEVLDVYKSCGYDFIVWAKMLILMNTLQTVRELLI